MSELVLISGGFDPIHSGHISLIQEASKYGEVVILLNSDRWLREKKGKEFLPFNEREIIMKSIKNVIDVLSFNDSDSYHNKNYIQNLSANSIFSSSLIFEIDIL